MDWNYFLLSERSQTFKRNSKEREGRSKVAENREGSGLQQPSCQSGAMGKPWALIVLHCGIITQLYTHHNQELYLRWFMICSFSIKAHEQRGWGGTVLNYPIYSQREAYAHPVLLRGPDYPGKLYEKILLQNKIAYVHRWTDRCTGAAQNKVHPCTQVGRCTGVAQNKVHPCT